MAESVLEVVHPQGLEPVGTRLLELPGMMDGRVQLKVAGFYDFYKNQQVLQFVDSCASGSTETNAGESRIYGPRVAVH